MIPSDFFVTTAGSCAGRMTDLRLESKNAFHSTFLIKIWGENLHIPRAQKLSEDTK